MKINYYQVALLLITLIATSCEKCYECTIDSSTTTYPKVSSMNTTTTSTVDFCGTNREKEDYERQGTVTTKSNAKTTSGNIEVTVKTTTTCQ
jgi:hypothetical protein